MIKSKSASCHEKKISFNKCKHTISNYIESERIPEPNSLNEMDLNNNLFKEDDGTPLLTKLIKQKVYNSFH